MKARKLEHAVESHPDNKKNMETTMPVKEERKFDNPPIIRDASSSKECEERVVKEREDAYLHGRDSVMKEMKE